MKRLTQFQDFNLKEFLKDKTLVVLGHDEWVDYSNGENVGIKYKLTILEDKTDYGNDNIGVNDGESFTVKVHGNLKKYHKLQEVKLVNGVAKVFGDYQNQLSVTADDVQFLEKGENNGKA